MSEDGQILGAEEVAFFELKPRMKASVVTVIMQDNLQPTTQQTFNVENLDFHFFSFLKQPLFAGEKPFPCDQSEKEFARKAALRIHKISVHSELKSYLCADCGAAFKANSALIDHKKRVHMQIKPQQ